METRTTTPAAGFAIPGVRAIEKTEVQS